MSIELTTASQLDAYALAIFNPHTDPLLGTVDGAATGLKGQSDQADADLYNIIKPVMEIIDGRTPAPGFKYTLNVTNMLQLRPKHWYMRGLMEYPVVQSTSLWPANMELAYVRNDLGVYDGVNSFGWSIGLATGAAICKAWACIIRMWMFNNYPEAVNKYTGPMPDDRTIGAAAAYGTDPNWDKVAVTGHG